MGKIEELEKKLASAKKEKKEQEFNKYIKEAKELLNKNFYNKSDSIDYPCLNVFRVIEINYRKIRCVSYTIYPDLKLIKNTSFLDPKELISYVKKFKHTINNKKVDEIFYKLKCDKKIISDELFSKF